MELPYSTEQVMCWQPVKEIRVMYISSREANLVVISLATTTKYSDGPSSKMGTDYGSWLRNKESTR